MSAAQVIDFEEFRQKRLEQKRAPASMMASPYPSNWVWVWMWPAQVVR